MCMGRMKYVAPYPEQLSSPSLGILSGSTQFSLGWLRGPRLLQKYVGSIWSSNDHVL
jgi:hypothetical protein